MIHTLEMYEELKAADLTENRSRAIVHVMRSVVDSEVADLLKASQFQLGFQELKNDIRSSRQESKQEMQQMVSDLEMRLVKYIFAQGVVVIGSVATLLHFLR